jgi:Eco57I restriction-modification methylase
VDTPLPPDIEAGVHDVSKRGGWNRPADDAVALPTETWRELVARRQRCLELRARLAAGEVHRIDDLITHNLDIRQFAQDAIAYCEGPELLRAFYGAITQVSVLDPTCGSGAFLFAALNILEPLYEACLERMQGFIEDARSTRTEGGFQDFRATLKAVQGHPNRAYFILKSIVLNNLYGVDIMEEAVEICKLRLFLKLAAQLEDVDHLEPLPDIDFNIRTGNTLVGFATAEEVRRAIGGGRQLRMDFDETMPRLNARLAETQHQFAAFRTLQTDLGEPGLLAGAKAALREKLNTLSAELDGYLAVEYGISADQKDFDLRFAHWRASHQPFHWLVEYFGVMDKGGFDVVIGNPPFVEYSKVSYRLRGYSTQECGNLYAYIIERSLVLLRRSGRMGLICPISLTAAQRMRPVQNLLLDTSRIVAFSDFALRPAALFQGVMQRISIFLCSLGQVEDSYTTDYITWYADERPVLFNTLHYSSLKGVRQPYSIPKIKGLVARETLHKILRSPRPWHSYREFSGSYVLYYHNAGGYWIKTFDFQPFYHSLRNPNKRHTTMSELRLSSVELQTTYLAVMNSNLFYFFWKSMTDARHVYPSDVAMLPIRLPVPQDLNSYLQQLNAQLMSSLRAHSERIVYGDAEVDQFRVSFSKPIIDEIDRVLAQHYGFTDEELDFIINYDIKYRMGQDADGDTE